MQLNMVLNILQIWYNLCFALYFLIYKNQLLKLKLLYVSSPCGGTTNYVDS